MMEDHENVGELAAPEQQQQQRSGRRKKKARKSGARRTSNGSQQGGGRTGGKQSGSMSGRPPRPPAAAASSGAQATGQRPAANNDPFGFQSVMDTLQGMCTAGSGGNAYYSTSFNEHDIGPSAAGRGAVPGQGQAGAPPPPPPADASGGRPMRTPKHRIPVPTRPDDVSPIEHKEESEGSASLEGRHRFHRHEGMRRTHSSEEHHPTHTATAQQRYRDHIERVKRLKQSGLRLERQQSQMSFKRRSVHVAGQDGAQVEILLSEFLASIPLFVDMPSGLLKQLERTARIEEYTDGDVIVRQGEYGTDFFIIQRGTVEILVRDPDDPHTEFLGRAVNKLTEGYFFGERALLTSQPRMASVRALGEAVCIVFGRDVFQAILANSDSLLGSDVADVDWTTDHEMRSLSQHLDQFLEAHETKESIPRSQSLLMRELITAFTPELNADEVIGRMTMITRKTMQADRVGLFILDDTKENMILKASQNAKGIIMPVGGLAGYIVTEGVPVNIPDAYDDTRFNRMMDRRTGYRTRQLACVPLRDPDDGSVMGALQVNNRIDTEDEPFTDEQMQLLQIAADRLGEVLIQHRAELLSEQEGSIRPVHEVTDNFAVRVSELSIPAEYVGDLANPARLEVGLYHGMEQLCDPISVTLRSSALGRAAKRSRQLLQEQIKEEARKKKEKKDQDLEYDEDESAEKARIDAAAAHDPLAVAATSSRRVKSGANGSDSNRDSAMRMHGAPTEVNSGEEIVFPIAVGDLPHATKMLCKLYINRARTQIAWAGARLFDFRGFMLSNSVDLPMFSGECISANPTTLVNKHDPKAIRVSLSFAERDYQIVYTNPTRERRAVAWSEERLPRASRDQLDEIEKQTINPEYTFDAETKHFVWGMREHLLSRPSLLPAFLLSVDWSNAEAVAETYDLLEVWDRPATAEALQLLDRRFADCKVRAFAVSCLEPMSDDELHMFMLQMVQQLKFEAFTDSALSRFLLRRALLSKHVVGHAFFWQLQAEMHVADAKERFHHLLDLYLKTCGSYRIALGHEMFVMRKLEAVAAKVKLGFTKAERADILHREMECLVLPEQFQLPLNPHLHISGVIPDKCRVMESKKKPLWLTFTIDSRPAPWLADDDESGAANAALARSRQVADKPKEIVVMFKAGDDLRQDQLTLQVLSIMEMLWAGDGLDLHMNIYGCIATGWELGMIQVVPEATTLARILMETNDAETRFRSSSFRRKTTTALRAMTGHTVLHDWLEEQVRDDALRVFNTRHIDLNEEDEMQRRVSNFAASCAGYCVGTYILGIGDRHNDNIMLQRSGNFFHIDFGHFLGRFKKKFGIKRERAPFVFTPAMAYLMGGQGSDQYSQFADMSMRAYRILRRNARLLVTLFTLMIPCGIPELLSEKDVGWVYNHLNLNLSDPDAEVHFYEKIGEALENRTTLFNDACHMIRHG